MLVIQRWPPEALFVRGNQEPVPMILRHYLILNTLSAIWVR